MMSARARPGTRRSPWPLPRGDDRCLTCSCTTRPCSVLLRPGDAGVIEVLTAYVTDAHKFPPKAIDWFTNLVTEWWEACSCPVMQRTLGAWNKFCTNPSWASNRAPDTWAQHSEHFADVLSTAVAFYEKHQQRHARSSTGVCRLWCGLHAVGWRSTVLYQLCTAAVPDTTAPRCLPAGLRDVTGACVGRSRLVRSWSRRWGWSWCWSWSCRCVADKGTRA